MSKKNDTTPVTGPVEQEVKETLNVLHLEKLRELQKNKSLVNKEYAEIGNLEYDLKKRKDSVERFVDDLRGKEHALLSEIKERYGEISVDLETGQYTILK